MVRHILKVLQQMLQMLQVFKECLTILGHYALKGQHSVRLPSKHLVF